jgi:hypothetical protein
MGNSPTKSDKPKSVVKKKNMEFKSKIDEVMERNKELEAENRELKKKNDIKNSLNQIDKQMIKHTVQKMLNNPNVNTGILPDKIEGKLYENMISFLLGLLKESLDTTKIEFLGHEIHIS